MARMQKIQQLARTLAYMLGRQPDEFGLLPDAEGYIKIKELLQAFSELEGWRHIRQNDLNELLLVMDDPPLEIKESRIRARMRDELPAIVRCPDPPKLLYTCVREKAYPHVIEKGILPTAHDYVLCTSDPALAECIGKRKSPRPVLLTVHPYKTAVCSMVFYRFGESIFLTDHIPPGNFNGPALAKKEPEKEAPSPHTADRSKGKAYAGTFIVTPEMAMPSSGGKSHKGQKKKVSWKEDRKQSRRRKNNFWPDK